MQPSQTSQPVPAQPMSDDDAQALPHISDVKINGPDAHIPVPHDNQVADPQKGTSQTQSGVNDRGEPVLEVNGGRQRAQIVDGGGKELWHDTGKPKQQGAHQPSTDDRDFLHEWDEEAHGEPVSKLTSDEELHAELGEEALQASGVQNVSDAQPTKPPYEPSREGESLHDIDFEDYAELVWKQVTEYAGEHGIKLTGPDTIDIVNRVLDEDGVTWKQARRMPVDERVEFDPAIFDQYR